MTRQSMAGSRERCSGCLHADVCCHMSLDVCRRMLTYAKHGGQHGQTKCIHASTPPAPKYIRFLTLLCIWQHGQTHCMQARRAPLAKRLLEPQMVFFSPLFSFPARRHEPQTAATSPFWGGGIIFNFFFWRCSRAVGPHSFVFTSFTRCTRS